MLEDFGIPVPGETVLIAASVYAGAGRLNVVAVGVVGFAAAVIGDNIGFAIGHEPRPRQGERASPNRSDLNVLLSIPWGLAVARLANGTDSPAH